MTTAQIKRAAQAVGNTHMRAAGRTEWSDDDWDAAAAEMVRLKRLNRRGQLTPDLPEPTTAPG